MKKNEKIMKIINDFAVFISIAIALHYAYDNHLPLTLVYLVFGFMCFLSAERLTKKEKEKKEEEKEQKKE